MRRTFAILPAAFLGLSLVNSSGPSSGSSILTADMLLHVDVAAIIGAEVPADQLQSVEWRFDEPQPGWKAVTPRPVPAGIGPATVSQTDDALRITLGPSTVYPGGLRVGGAYVDVPAWDPRDWDHVVIRARMPGPGGMTIAFNMWDRERHFDESLYEMLAGATRFVGDNTVQTYQLPLEPRTPGKGRGTRPEESRWEGPIEQLVVEFWSRGPLEADILSITVVPAAREALSLGYVR